MALIFQFGAVNRVDQDRKKAERLTPFDSSIACEPRLCNLQIGRSGDVGEEHRLVVFGQVPGCPDASGLLVAYLPPFVGNRSRPRRLAACTAGRFGSQIAQGFAPQRMDSGGAVVGEVGLAFAAHEEYPPECRGQ